MVVLDTVSYSVGVNKSPRCPKSPPPNAVDTEAAFAFNCLYNFWICANDGLPMIFFFNGCEKPAMIVAGSVACKNDILLFRCILRTLILILIYSQVLDSVVFFLSL